MSEQSHKGAIITAIATVCAAVITLVGTQLFQQRTINNSNITTVPTPAPNNLNTGIAPIEKESAQDTNLLLEETFSTASLNNHWQVITGNWYVKDGSLNGVSTQKNSWGGPVWAIVTLDKDLPANHSITFRTKIIDGAVSELMLHLSNNRYVRVYLYSIDQAIKLGDGDFLEENKPGQIGLDEIMNSLGGGETVAQHGFPIASDIWYSVKVTAKDSTYTINVGGQRMLQYEDVNGKLNKEGTIGFISNGHMQYDDIKISKLDN